MKHLIGYTDTQLHRPHTNQKPLVAERLAASHERMRFVDICMIPPCQNLGKGADFLTHLCYNQLSHKSETALVLATPNAASNHQSKGTRPMADIYSTYSNSNRIPHTDVQPERTPPVPRGQMVVRVEDADGINVIFDPPIPCVMRDPDGRRRHVSLGDTDALVELVFAGWQMVEVA